MLMVQSVARALQEAGETDPLKFLTDLNRAIYKNIERTRADKHLTLSFLDYDGKQLTVSGQHEELIVIRRSGEVERIDTGDLGLPVGLEADISSFVGIREIPFQTGDLIVLHTDGVTEAENLDGELFGIERLCETARRLHGRTAEQVMNGVLDSLMAYIGTQKIHDDITLVVMRHR
jgi:sigma-B regulation protein RsbU (phosphoserine phosphatase)